MRRDRAYMQRKMAYTNTTTAVKANILQKYFRCEILQ